MDKEGLHTAHLEGIDYRTGQPVRVTLTGSVITDIQAPGNVVPEDLPWIAPGLVDLQVNGFQNLDFNSTEITPDGIRAITKALHAQGVTTFYPTLITNSVSAINAEIDIVTEACHRYPEVSATIGGIHLEGPFLSPETEPRGAHDAAYILPPDWALFCQWQERARGKIKLITISPEWSDASAFIRQCVHSGVVVSIGHTAATAQQIMEAVAAGATLSTHFGNGAHLSIPRRNNYFWEQLANDALQPTLIADGYHLTDALTHVILKVKGDKAMLVSDSTRFAGATPGRYATHIGGAVVLDENGRLYLEHNPNLLAGSASSILAGVNTLIKKQLASLPQAWNMASIIPTAAIDRIPFAPRGLNIGATADFALFRHTNEKIQILKTIKAGITVFDNSSN